MPNQRSKDYISFSSLLPFISWTRQEEKDLKACGFDPGNRKGRGPHIQEMHRIVHNRKAASLGQHVIVPLRGSRCLHCSVCGHSRDFGNQGIDWRFAECNGYPLCSSNFYALPIDDRPGHWRRKFHPPSKPVLEEKVADPTVSKSTSSLSKDRFPDRANSRSTAQSSHEIPR